MDAIEISRLSDSRIVISVQCKYINFILAVVDNGLAVKKQYFVFDGTNVSSCVLDISEYAKGRYITFASDKLNCGRGSVISDTMILSDEFIANMIWLNEYSLPEQENTLNILVTDFHLKCATQDIPIESVSVIDNVDADSFVKFGDIIQVGIKLKKKAFLCEFDVVPRLCRFIITLNEKVIAVGTILKLKSQYIYTLETT
jgi:translation elongation factor EF-1alpha